MSHESENNGKVDNALAQNFFVFGSRSSIHAPQLEFLNVFGKMPLSSSLSFPLSLPPFLFFFLSLYIYIRFYTLAANPCLFFSRAQYALKLRAEWFRSISRSFIGSLPKLYLFFFSKQKNDAAKIEK